MDFGSIVDYDEITTNKFFSGEHGLHGLLHLFEAVLDSFPIIDSRYTEYMTLFSGFAMLLAKHILNFSKVRLITVHVCRLSN